MPRPSLTDPEIQAFRARLADASFRLFSRLGAPGVTLRAVATELGVSPMTPYRYVADKEELLALGRAQAFRLFAESQEAAVATRALPLNRLERLFRAYIAFALERPDGYRLMFSAGGPDTGCAELEEQSARAFRPLLEATRAAVNAKLERGDPVVLAHLHWATAHGLVSLHLNGKLMQGTSLERLCEQMLRDLRRSKGSKR